ncbi:hypothetical protein [Pseudomonas sp. C2B4]|uniref:hypothetical protein n=1 Tax=Pseudomonas sp. C2B4 TaxID=2735270 RepID=UPI0015862796|nr:hypothetical protein [Pseudomonas sp. C2B4]NUU38106.1 hypothetical protein [Pseudomonas sp. C2B4]
MNISTLCLLGGLLVSAGASANGVIPVLELDFTRSATETLKKHGISDACIISAATPSAFTYCREGSATLWKYQTLDMDPQASPLQGTRPASMAGGRISVAEVDSPACAEDTPRPLVNPVITRAVALGLIILFVFIGLRYTYRATKDGLYARPLVSGTHMHRSAGSMHTSRHTTKALTAFAIAAGVAFFYFGYTAL